MNDVQVELFAKNGQPSEPRSLETPVTRDEVILAWHHWVARQSYPLLPCVWDLANEVFGLPIESFADIGHIKLILPLVTELREEGRIAMRRYVCQFCGKSEWPTWPTLLDDSFWEAHQTYGQRRCGDKE